MPNLDAEQALEDRTMQLFHELGWQTANAYYEAFDPGKAAPRRPYLGRSGEHEVLLRPRLRTALRDLNPDLPEAALDAAMAVLAQGRSMVAPVAANREVHDLLRNRVRVTYRDAEGREEAAHVRVIDWETPANNDFLMVQQLWVSGDLGRKRPDLVGFVNGIPLLFGELKAHHRRLANAYNRNLSDYRETIPHLFVYTGLVILSNGSRSAVGNADTPFRHFSTWKKVNDESEAGVISLETMVRGACTPARLLDLVENYTLYHEGAGGLRKITAKNHQYLGVENVLAALAHVGANRGRLGVFWHTQGSGKSFSMIFFARKALRTLGGNWTFLIVTDRRDLDDQIYRTFARAGVLTEDEAAVRAQSGADLKAKLREDHRFLFTLIHKFHTRDGARYPVLSERDDVIVITDEAHRTQYGTFATNMRDALPNAAFIGFTGTPLMADERERTREVFGDYVSVYDFKQSMADGATVPLYYENRVPELQLTNEELNLAMADALERADLDEDARDALGRSFVREYQLITRDDRLDTIAEDIVDHFTNRGYMGKAMVISLDKLTTVKMYDKVQAHWEARLADLRARFEAAPDAERPALAETIALMEATDMAVVISQAQNEIAEFRAHGLDLRPHRRRMINEALDEKFKNPDDPFRLVFVCAMWRTGFDAPSCSTLYLDRPMRNHTLMQTIARANRVYGEKHNGLIVDYLGIFRELQTALAIYATGDAYVPDDYPVKPKDALIAELETALADVDAFCDERGVDLDAILETTDAFARIAAIDTLVETLVDARAQAALDDAVEQIIVNDALKLRFSNLVSQVDRLYKAVQPDPRAGDYSQRRKLLRVLRDKIHRLGPHLETGDVASEVTEVLDASIKALPYVIREDTPLYDLSKVDFDALRERFETGRKRTEAEKLRGTVHAKMQRMVRRNRTRTDYQAEYQRLIDAYNAGAANVEAHFNNLVAFAQKLRDEDARHLREHLTEEELAVFDILTKPPLALTEAERAAVKAVAKDLLATLKRETLVLDWKKRQQYQASVRLAIEDMLYDRLPERYTADLCDRKRDDLYRHFYDNYQSGTEHIYAAG
jgi:type I restriction enzyme, R subunit